MKKLSIALVVALLCGAVAMVGTAGARGKAATTVTIKFNGDGTSSSASQGLASAMWMDATW